MRPLRDIIYRVNKFSAAKAKGATFSSLGIGKRNNIWKILMYQLNIANQTGQTGRFCHAKSTSQPNADEIMT